MEDNTACIAISANPVHHQRTKHIAKYYHYCRDLVLAGEIELVGVGTKYQVADIFTKPLERDTFRRLSSVFERLQELRSASGGRTDRFHRHHAPENF